MMQNDESTKIIIGLTGGSGSGKSTIGKSCEDYDCLYIDADKIGQEVILRGQPGYDEVLAVFGNEILGANEEIDRRKLGGVVFSNPEKLKILNSISHRHITEKIKEMVSITDKKFIIIDGAVIIGSIVEGMCDYIISVISSKEIRLGRILERDD
ncbi:MAG: dephospho-CoA kinase, partial [Eubacteriales bacterium]|nr:dephospho-CoA kinase [Eubacteriales bacterium]